MVNKMDEFWLIARDLQRAKGSESEKYIKDVLDDLQNGAGKVSESISTFFMAIVSTIFLMSALVAQYTALKMISLGLTVFSFVILKENQGKIDSFVRRTTSDIFYHFGLKRLLRRLNSNAYKEVDIEFTELLKEEVFHRLNINECPTKELLRGEINKKRKIRFINKDIKATLTKELQNEIMSCDGTIESLNNIKIKHNL